MVKFINNKFQFLKIVQLITRFILGGIFIYASIDKIAFPSDFMKAIQGYDILPFFLIKPVALILPWFELIFGIFLLVGLFIKESAFVLTSLMAVFLIALGIQATKGPVEDCGCFGNLSIFSSSNIFVLFLRDLVFISLGLIIMVVESRINLTKRV